MIRSREARRRAQAILDMLGVDNPPVNVHEIANELGFEVIPYDFPEETSAVLHIDAENKAIGVNRHHSKTRQRFSIAHELGHFLQGHGDFGDSVATFEDGSYNYADPQNRQESEANELAAELLMPEKMLNRDLRETGLDVPRLAETYQVSEQAMWIQLINLRLAAED